MTDLNDIWTLDATAQADLVRAGEVTPRELVEVAIGRIEHLNPMINAVVSKDYEAALEAADTVCTGNLFPGVPFLLKDMGATYAHKPYHLGNRALKSADYRAIADTVLAQRFRNTGLIFLGKTNLPELASCPTTQPLAYGPTHNPWNTEFSPAGSSGGSAAAVAAGMVPMAHANDGGGSTRLPAAWTGTVGLKTTRGRQPEPDTTDRRRSELVITRSIRDVASVLDATCGHTSGDLFQLPPPEKPYRDVIGMDEGPLKIGILLDAGYIGETKLHIHPDCIQATELAAHLLENWGHHVEFAQPHVLLGKESDINGAIFAMGLARRVDALGELLGRPLQETEVEPYNWAAATLGRNASAADMLSFLDRQQQWSVKVCEWMDTMDVLLTPTSVHPPLKTEDLYPEENNPLSIGKLYGEIARFTLPFNVTGHPGISLPIHWSAEGLPIGIQLVAGMGCEDRLLRLASRFEQSLPWSAKWPTVLNTQK